MNTWTRHLSIAALALATALPAIPAYARHGDGHGWGYRPPAHHHGHYRGGVWAPLVVGGLIGAAIVGASSAYAQPPAQPVVVPVQPAYPPSHLVPTPVAPPVVVMPAPQPVQPRVQYYCAPYRQYYPQVGTCPEPWYLMPY